MKINAFIFMNSFGSHKKWKFKAISFLKVEEIFDIFDDDGNEPQGEGPYPFMVS